MNLNLSGFVNVFSPLGKAFEGRGVKSDIKAVVLDKDDCFAYPNTNEIYPAYVKRFQQLRREYPGHSLLVVSNTAGATTYDRDGRLAKELESVTGVSVLAHDVKKPGCRDEIMTHFRNHPETGVTHPSDVVVIGDRLMTDMMLANMMGSWGIWIKNGVKPLKEKSIFSKFEQRLEPFLVARGVWATDPKNPFE